MDTIKFCMSSGSKNMEGSILKCFGHQLDIEDFTTYGYMVTTLNGSFIHACHSNESDFSFDEFILPETKKILFDSEGDDCTPENLEIISKLFGVKDLTKDDLYNLVTTLTEAERGFN